MKKGIFFGILVIIAVLASAAGAGAYYIGSLQRGNAFLEGTKLNGRDVSGQTPAQVTAGYASEVAAGEVVLMEDGKEVFRAPLSDLGYSLDEKAFETSLTKFMESEKVDSETILHSLVNGNTFTLRIDMPDQRHPDLIAVLRHFSDTLKLLILEISQCHASERNRICARTDCRIH